MSSEKTINVIKWENGFVNPIKIVPGPGGGAYLQEEIEMVVPDDEENVVLNIYYISKIETKRLK